MPTHQLQAPYMIQFSFYGWPRFQQMIEDIKSSLISWYFTKPWIKNGISIWSSPCPQMLFCLMKRGHFSLVADYKFSHDDVIKWKHFPRYWPFVWGIHRSPVNSTHKGQWRGAMMLSLICVRTNGWVNNRELVIWDAIALIMTSQ